MTAFILPSSRSAGDVLTAAIWNQDVVTNLSEAFPDGAEAWATWTPTVKFGATTATVANDSKVMRIGRLVVAELRVRFTNLNSGTGTLSVVLPYAARRADTAAVVHDYMPVRGSAQIFDVSAGVAFGADIVGNTADGSDATFVTRVAPGTTAAPTGANRISWSNTVPMTVAVGALNTGDELTASLWYEAAS